MPQISAAYPDLAFYLIVEVMKEPTGHFWNLTISLRGEEPPPPLRPLRVFRILGTTEALEQALKDYPCDNVNIFAEPSCPDSITQTVRSIFERRALKLQEAGQ